MTQPITVNPSDSQDDPEGGNTRHFDDPIEAALNFFANDPLVAKPGTKFSYSTRFVVPDSPQMAEKLPTGKSARASGERQGSLSVLARPDPSFPRSQSCIAVVAVNDFEIDASR